MFPDDGKYGRDNYKKHIAFFDAGAKHSQRLFAGGNRPLEENTLVCMADGTKKSLKDIKIGDTVLALNATSLVAEPTKVLDIPFIGAEKCYEITTSRGQKVTATADHEFLISKKSGSSYTEKLAIKEIPTGLSVSKRKGLITPKLVDYKEKTSLPLHPYVLGALLGDGSIKYSTITFTNVDDKVLNKFLTLSEFETTKRDITYFIKQGNRRNIKNGQYIKGTLREILNSLNLKDKTHIPLNYLTASENDRLELLAGLIDTDGTHEEFVNKHEGLVEDFCQLVISLGGYASYKQTEKVCTNTGVRGTYYRAYYRINRKLPLALEYKQPKQTVRKCDYSRNPIESIKYVGIKNVRCIHIEHEDHLFLVNDFIATSNTGKTQAGGTEVTYHLTGLYPDWWKGKRFLNPIKVWAAGVSISTVREVMQEALLGPFNDLGSGLIPKDLIVGTTRKSGVPNTIDMVRVKHVSGGVSELIFKSYEQGRIDFQGTKKDLIWLDEEPRDGGIYEECLMRLMDDVTPGILMITFTPLLGLTPLVQSFLEGGRFPEDGINPKDQDKFAVQVTWDEVPHLSEEQKEKMMKSLAPHVRAARTKGIPSLGAGAIYPYAEDDILVRPFKIPDFWPRAFGFDVGWNKTAAIWVALDPDSDTYYLYSEHYVGQAVAAVHASAIKARGDWIPGVIDYGANAVSATDGTRLMDQYLDEGLYLEIADKAIEAGILRICQLIESGRLKVFNTLTNWLNEFRIYMRDEKTGKPKDKQDDHLMDAMRYVLLKCPDVLMLPPDPDDGRDFRRREDHRDSITGY